MFQNVSKCSKMLQMARNFREEQKHDERAILMVFYWTQLNFPVKLSAVG
jgi:hypothetical protein